MKAKDTVMGQWTIKNKYGVDFGNEVWKTIQPLLSTQAEISFAAGEKFGIEKGAVMVNAANAENLRQMHKAGIQEVVDWMEKRYGDCPEVIDKSGDGPDLDAAITLYLTRTLWEAQKKKWGI